jgi:hypothetical protein
MRRMCKWGGKGYALKAYKKGKGICVKSVKEWKGVNWIFKKIYFNFCFVFKVFSIDFKVERQNNWEIYVSCFKLCNHKNGNTNKGKKM